MSSILLAAAAALANSPTEGAIIVIEEVPITTEKRTLNALAHYLQRSWWGQEVREYFTSIWYLASQQQFDTIENR
jgi:hypothetical protein